MRDAIRKFPEQFTFVPEVLHEEHLQRFTKYLVAGMGGSVLAPGLIRSALPEIDVVVHRDYGLPTSLDSERLTIVSSYSGNTEESVSAYST
ncbi:MAG: hypothetical protein ABIG71_01670, partial [Candidatus Uhrbacteria bacterium]